MGMMFQTRYILSLVPYNWNLVIKNKNSKKHNAANMLQTSVKALISGLSGLGMCCAILQGFGSLAYSGSLDSPAPPDDNASAMYSLDDLYNRFSTGVVGAKRTGAFNEPGSTPSPTGHTMDDLMSVAPTKDNVNGAVGADVVTGKKYWGLTDGNWGQQSDGTIPNIGQQNITPGSAIQTISQGYHDGTGVVYGDLDLTSSNIKNGVDIFGVIGSTHLVDTSTGDALTGEILTGKKLWVGGAEITGSMANIGQLIITPSTTLQTITQGYHDGTGTVTGDVNLVVGNVKNGVTIFGVTGDSNVVDTTSGDATFAEIAIGKKVWVDGIEITGGCSGTLNGTRWCDNADGTVTDMITGLVWLQNAYCTGYQNVDWSTAISKPIDLKVGLCGLSGTAYYSGDWRLPTRRELEGLANGQEAVRYNSQRAFTGIKATNYENDYWSSTTWEAVASHAWTVRLSTGGSGKYDKTTALKNVLPVRNRN